MLYKKRVLFSSFLDPLGAQKSEFWGSKLPQKGSMTPGPLIALTLYGEITLKTNQLSWLSYCHHAPSLYLSMYGMHVCIYVSVNNCSNCSHLYTLCRIWWNLDTMTIGWWAIRWAAKFGVEGHHWAVRAHFGPISWKHAKYISSYRLYGTMSKLCHNSTVVGGYLQGVQEFWVQGPTWAHGPFWAHFVQIR